MSLHVHAVQLRGSNRFPRKDGLPCSAGGLQLLLHHLPEPDEPRHAVYGHIEPNCSPISFVGLGLDDGDGAPPGSPCRIVFSEKCAQAIAHELPSLPLTAITVVELVAKRAFLIRRLLYVPSFCLQLGDLHLQLPKLIDKLAYHLRRHTPH